MPWSSSTGSPPRSVGGCGMPDTAVTTTDFDFIRQVVREQSALVLSDGKEYLVTGRLAPILRREGLGSISQLVDRLREGSTGLRDDVVQAMATNETSFFRDRGPFELLRREVLPAILRERPRDSLRLWSAATSTGQEAFSLAMVLCEDFAGLASASIMATDLCRDVLTTARSASFNQLEMDRGLPAALRIKYFEQQGVRWRLRDEVRDLVTFRRLNLARPLPALPHMDVVFLRNVLIYFDDDTKAAVLQRVAAVMRPGGYLFLGNTETPSCITERFERVRADRTVCYRLRQGGGA